MQNNRAGRTVATVAGAILVLLSIGLLVVGGTLLWVHGTRRDVAGFYTTPTTRVATAGYAVTFDAQLGSVNWTPADLLGDIRVRATAEGDRSLFIGVAPRDEVTTWLAGVAHDRLTTLSLGPVASRTQWISGGHAIGLPTAQTFWVASSHGTGTQSLVWTPRAGDWSVVLMNTDAARGLAVSADAGVSSTILLPAGLTAGAIGLLLLAVATLLLVLGLGGWGGQRPAPKGAQAVDAGTQPDAYPVRLEGHLDQGVSRWLWIVKWLLVIPHWIVLLVLWPVALVVTVVAGFAILITGRYPRALFDFNLGVMRWSWRVSFYTVGAFASDRYPPFSLAADPTYPADLAVDYPERLSRGLVLVKWWLLALPQYLVVGFFVGGGALGWRAGWPLELGGGLIGILALIAVVVLAASGRYPESVFDFVMGLNRWCYRVLAYALLMRDEYPPFRLDAGGPDPGSRTPENVPPALPGGDLAGAHG